MIRIVGKKITFNAPMYLNKHDGKIPIFSLFAFIQNQKMSLDTSTKNRDFTIDLFYHIDLKEKEFRLLNIAVFE